MEHFPPPIKLEPLVRRKRGKGGAGRSRPELDSLRQLRERKGVTLDEIAERTRIPLQHLLELERGDVSNWPAGVYAKSWAREYAHEAGIDPDRVEALVAPVAHVEESTDDIKQAREERDRFVVQPEVPPAPIVRTMRRFAALALVLTLIALAALYFLQQSGSSRAADPAPAPIGTSGPGQPPKPLR